MTRSVLLASLVILAGSLSAQAGVYPTNKCVSDKQKEAAKYCSGVLKAWARWDQKQDDAARDQTLSDASSRLDSKWTKAEDKSSAKGSECGETTLSSTDMATLIDAAVGSVVSAVNTGLDLGSKSDRKCGGKLLSAAAKKCSSLLKAESKYIKKIAKAPETTGLDADQQAASAKFSSDWAKTAGDCPTTATEEVVEALIDDLSDNVVTSTTVSPSVGTQWAAYLAPDSVDYQGRTFTPKCVFDTPYYYAARRGSVNKLVMYYMGGGACWENITCSLGVCSQSTDPNDLATLNALTGFFDLSDPNNPFKDWSWVFVSYCSCDIHFGDAEQTYSGIFPEIDVKHFGYHNARVVEKWAREHFVNPETVFVTGTSGGGYGALFNGSLHRDVWPASRLHVLGDASNGVITGQFLEIEFENWNFRANLPPEIPGLLEAVDSGTGLVGYMEVITNHTPDTNWAHYTTAYDGGTGGQTGFYNIMLNDNDVEAAVPWWEGSCAFNSGMRQQAVDTVPLTPGNYRYYIGPGSRHGMWDSDKVYTDTIGGVPTIVNWVNAMLNSTPGAPDPDWTNVEASPFNVLLDGECSSGADNPGARCGCNDDCPNGSCLGENVRPCPLLAPFELSGDDTIVSCPQ